MMFEEFNIKVNLVKIYLAFAFKIMIFYLASKSIKVKMYVVVTFKVTTFADSPSKFIMIYLVIVYKVIYLVFVCKVLCIYWTN